MTRAESLWTIDELGAQVALALSVDYEGAPNSRVRDVPDRDNGRRHSGKNKVRRTCVCGAVAHRRRLRHGTILVPASPRSASHVRSSDVMMTFLPPLAR